MADDWEFYRLVMGGMVSPISQRATFLLEIAKDPTGHADRWLGAEALLDLNKAAQDYVDWFRNMTKPRGRVGEKGQS